jgi:hypothetical protein
MVPATDGSAIVSLGPGPRFDLGPADPAAAIAELVLLHQGADQAITIEGIAKKLWPYQWGFITDDSTGHPIYPNRARLQREIKGYVADLVNLEKKVIVSNRGHRNPGYYVPIRREEIDAAERTFIRQAVAMIQRARRLTGNARYEELAGQLTLMAKVGTATTGN